MSRNSAIRWIPRHILPQATVATEPNWKIVPLFQLVFPINIPDTIRAVCYFSGIYIICGSLIICTLPFLW
jgi:hypothetical protein